MDPVWLGGVVYFLSDRDGVSNVWGYDTRTKKLGQVTNYTDFDVKTLDAGAGVLVFEQAGNIHEIDPGNERDRVVNVTAVGDFPWMMAQWKDVSNRMTNLALSATGKRAAVEARGEIFTIPAEKGDVRNLTNSSGSAEICARVVAGWPLHLVLQRQVGRIQAVHRVAGRADAGTRDHDSGAQPSVPAVLGA